MEKVKVKKVDYITVKVLFEDGSIKEYKLGSGKEYLEYASKLEWCDYTFNLSKIEGDKVYLQETQETINYSYKISYEYCEGTNPYNIMVVKIGVCGDDKIVSIYEASHGRRSKYYRKLNDFIKYADFFTEDEIVTLIESEEDNVEYFKNGYKFRKQPIVESEEIGSIRLGSILSNYEIE